MERPKLGYCQRIDLAPNVLLVDTAKLSKLVEWSVWAEQELSKLHQPTVISSVCTCITSRETPMINGRYICSICNKPIEQTDL